MGTQVLRNEFLIKQVFGTCAVNCFTGKSYIKDPSDQFSCYY